MTYITGTITDPNPGPALYALIGPAFTSAGMTLVDTVVISARTHKIWLSPGASNAIGKDFYYDVAYTTAGAGQLFIGVMEFFDAATDLGYRMQWNGNVAVKPSDAVYFSPFGATGATLEAGASGVNPHAGNGADQDSNANLAIGTAAFGYWITITKDRVIAMVSASPTRMVYAGTYIPNAVFAAAAGADLYPVIGAKLGVAGGLQNPYSTWLTRLPKLVTATGTTWLFQTVAPLGTSTTNNLFRLPGIPNDLATVYPRSAALFTVGTVGLSGSTAGVWPSAYLGQLRDVANIGAEATVVRGDTVSDGTNSWVLSSSAGGMACLFKAV